MIRIIGLEAWEARIGRELSSEEITQLRVLDGILVLHRMALEGEADALLRGDPQSATKFAKAGARARGMLAEFE